MRDSFAALVLGEDFFAGDRKGPVLAIKLHQDDVEPLRLIRSKPGGKIYGPYSRWAVR